MDRKLLILSTIMVLAGLLLMAYSDPAVRVGLGIPTGSTTTVSFSRTRTFPFGNETFAFPGNGTFSRTFSIPRGGFPITRGVVISTTTQAESLIGLGLVAIGLLFEAFTLFLWQSPADQESTPKK